MIDDRPAFIQLVNQTYVIPRAHNIDDNAQHDQSRPEPEGRPVRPRLEIRTPILQSLQKQTEARDDKTEAHEREPGSNPGQKSPLGGEIVTGTASRSFCHLFTMPLR